MNSNAEEPYGVLERMIRSSILWLKTDNRVPLPLTLLLACSFGYTSNVVQLYILNFRRQFCWKKFYGILLTTVIYVVSTFHFNYSSIPILPSPPNHTFQTNISVSSQPRSLEWLCLHIQSDVLDTLCQIHLHNRSPDIKNSAAYSQIYIIPE